MTVYIDSPNKVDIKSQYYIIDIIVAQKHLKFISKYCKPNFIHIHIIHIIENFATFARAYSLLIFVATNRSSNVIDPCFFEKIIHILTAKFVAAIQCILKLVK